MDLKYRVLLDKEFDGVPSRSERAHVVVAMLEGDNPYFIVQYHHHEGTSNTVGDDSNILENIKLDFEGADRRDYPGTDAMLDEIKGVIVMNFDDLALELMEDIE